MCMFTVDYTFLRMVKHEYITSIRLNHNTISN